MRLLTSDRMETLREEEIDALLSTLSEVRGDFLTRLCDEVHRAMMAPFCGHGMVFTGQIGVETASLDYDSEEIISFIRGHVSAV